MLIPNIDLENKTVLITGAAGCIGSNLVMELMRTMDSVTIVGLDSMNDYYDVSIKEYRLAEIEKLAVEHSFCTWELSVAILPTENLLTIFLKNTISR